MRRKRLNRIDSMTKTTTRHWIRDAVRTLCDHWVIKSINEFRRLHLAVQRVNRLWNPIPNGNRCAAADVAISVWFESFPSGCFRFDAIPDETLRLFGWIEPTDADSSRSCKLREKIKQKHTQKNRPIIDDFTCTIRQWSGGKYHGWTRSAYLLSFWAQLNSHYDSARRWFIRSKSSYLPCKLQFDVAQVFSFAHRPPPVEIKTIFLFVRKKSKKKKQFIYFVEKWNQFASTKTHIVIHWADG